MANGSSLIEKKMEADTEDLDLVKYTLRAIGILQAVQHMPFSLLNLEENLPVVLQNKEILVDVESAPGPELPFQQIVDPSSLSESLFEPFEATRLTTITTNDTFRSGSSCNALFPLPSPDGGVNSVSEIKNLRSFVENWKMDWKLDDYLRDILPPQGDIHFCVSNIPQKSDEEKVDVYWGLTFLGKTGALVGGILASVPSLEQMGIKNWILPTGDKIPLSSLRPTIFEVVPTNVYSVKQKISRAVDVPLIPLGVEPSGDIPRPEFIGSGTRKIVTTVNNAGDKLAIRHVVLSAELPDGTLYIVDPTGRQFGYKGANGSVIIHGKLDEYKKNFPGQVVGQHNDTPLDPSAAEGFIPVVQRLLAKYFEKRLCAYCGEIDELHPKPIATVPLHIDHSKLLLAAGRCCLEDCKRCKGVAYCSKLCRELDWENHKPSCK
ncbi:uncharacterized protein LOC110849677 [Folsomia candida]|uniref:Ubiquitin carboxyl-terminal hydrolase 19 n=1 Tax=Folsomia candida TaxID=158441 RepID=A0A226E9T5_FOLCA|nr:uncharacterized protein LOC110849677 [Folsomia candida]XP_021952803.1 uncharacterized protein LOC110849677 [Folsomia candida]OXA54140.1 Ubiquitin carboxyl-terminal hydrolase 19 [Folsomia candida]